MRGRLKGVWATIEATSQNTHRQGSEYLAPVPWRWRSREATIRGSHRPVRQAGVKVAITLPLLLGLVAPPPRRSHAGQLFGWADTLKDYRLGWLEPFLEPGLPTITTLLLCTTMMQFYERDNPYHRRMWDAY